MSGIVGLENNNIFNIQQTPEPTPGHWFGSIGQDAINGHAIFPPGEGGRICNVRAHCRDLYRRQWLPVSGDRAGTLLEIFSSYAPDGHAGNNALKYAEFVARRIGLTISEPIWFTSKDGTIRDIEFLKRYQGAVAEYEIFAGFVIEPTGHRNGIQLYKRHLASGMWLLAP